MRPIIFNPVFKEYKDPVGAVLENQEIFITLHISRSYDLYQVRLIVKDDGNSLFGEWKLDKYELNQEYNAYYMHFHIKESGLYWYYFEFDDIFGTHFISSTNNLDGVLANYSPTSWQLLIHKPFSGDFSWYKGKIMYQIMVDRFFSVNPYFRRNAYYHQNWDEIPNYQPQDGKILNNDFFGGNLRGIIEKLEYLKSLQVGVIYLNPIFEAFSNHKYDTGDYRKIDPQFGTEEDFIELCRQAEEKGIRIILDGVFNHTGDDSKYFNKYGHYPEMGAYQSQASPYFNWYQFTDWPDEYRSWWGVKTLPSVNQNSGFSDYIAGRNGVIEIWLKKGAKGFRLDVVDELDDPFLDKIHQAVKQSNPDAILIGEVWEDASNKISYNKRRRYFSSAQLDSVMNYPLKNAIFDFLINNNYLGLKHQIRHIINNYPKEVLDKLMNHLGTHDTVRLLSNFSNPPSLTVDEQAYYRMNPEEYRNAVVHLKLATAIQYTLPGIPSVFYGDETGLEGFCDPFCRHPLVWEKTDQEILSWYKMLGTIRNDSVYQDGIYQEEYIDNNIFAYSRVHPNRKIMTIINNSQTAYTIPIPEGYDLISNHKVAGKLTVARKQAKIIRFDQ